MPLTGKGSRISSFLKSVAGLTLICFVVTQVLAPGPEGLAQNSTGPESASSPVPIAELLTGKITVPSELGLIDEIYHGSRNLKREHREFQPEGRVPEHEASKTIILIRDAHDLLEAQENIARLITRFVTENNIRTVFEEGYEGPVPTDEFFSFIKDPAIRQKVSYFLLDKLRIGGAEYAHINREQDFELIGVENLDLYSKNIEAYRDSSRKRKDTEADLDELLKHILILANRYFPKELKSWLRSRERYSKVERPLLDYLKALRTLYPKNVADPDSFFREYPALSILLAAETTRDKKLIGQLNTLDSRVIFEEMSRLEEGLSKTFLQNDRDKKIFDYYQGLSLLKRLNQIQLTQAEYEAAKKALEELDTREMAGFIVSLTSKSLVLSKEWERNIKDSIRFYEIAAARDHSITKWLDKFLSAGNVELETGNEKELKPVDRSTSTLSAGRSPNSAMAVLVYGGFHATAIKELLKDQGLSYVVVSPRINKIEKRHQDYYRQLMSVGHHGYEIAFRAARAARQPTTFVRALGEDGSQSIRHELEAIAKVVATLGDRSSPQLIEKYLPKGSGSFRPLTEGKNITRGHLTPPGDTPDFEKDLRMPKLGDGPERSELRSEVRDAVVKDPKMKKLLNRLRKSIRHWPDRGLGRLEFVFVLMGWIVEASGFIFYGAYGVIRGLFFAGLVVGPILAWTVGVLWGAFWILENIGNSGNIELPGLLLVLSICVGVLVGGFWIGVGGVALLAQVCGAVVEFVEEKTEWPFDFIRMLNDVMLKAIDRLQVFLDALIFKIRWRNRLKALQAFRQYVEQKGGKLTEDVLFEVVFPHMSAHSWRTEEKPSESIRTEGLGMILDHYGVHYSSERRKEVHKALSSLNSEDYVVRPEDFKDLSSLVAGFLNETQDPSIDVTVAGEKMHAKLNLIKKQKEARAIRSRQSSNSAPGTLAGGHKPAATDHSPNQDEDGDLWNEKIRSEVRLTETKGVKTELRIADGERFRLSASKHETVGGSERRSELRAQIQSKIASLESKLKSTAEKWGVGPLFVKLFELPANGKDFKDECGKLLAQIAEHSSDLVEAKTFAANAVVLISLRIAGSKFIERYEEDRFVDPELLGNAVWSLDFLLRDWDSGYADDDPELSLLVQKMQAYQAMRLFFDTPLEVYYRPWFSSFLLNYVLRERPEIVKSLLILNPEQNLVGLLEDWSVQAHLGFSEEECGKITILRDIVKFYQLIFRDFKGKDGKIFGENQISGQFQGDLQMILENDAARDLIHRDLGALKNLITIMLTEHKSVGASDGYGEVRYILESFIPKGLPMMQGVLNQADPLEILDAVANIASVGGDRLQPIIRKLIGKNPAVGDKYLRLINGSVEHFKQIGLILLEVGEIGFDLIPFEKLMERYRIERGSDSEGRLLEIVANIARSAKEGTAGLVAEVFDLYSRDAGETLDDLNKLLRAFTYFVRVVNFHYEFEKLVLSGEIGQVNNETYFVSLRDLKKTLQIVKRNFFQGMEIKESVAQAVRRRYFNRLSPEDRGRIRGLMVSHRLIHPSDELDFFYDISGYEIGSREIVITERRRPRQIQRRQKNAKGEWEIILENLNVGEPRKVLRIELASPLETGDIDPDIVFNETTRRNLAVVLEALEVQDGEKFNPVLEFGTTAGGKSTIARIAAKVLRVGYTRIQINDRTDEFDLFGSFQPYEIRMQLDEAVSRIRESLERGEYNVLEDVLSRLLTGGEGKFWQSFFTEEERQAVLEGKSGFEYHEAKRQAIRKRVLARIENILDGAGKLLLLENAPLNDPQNKERAQLIRAMAYMLNHEVGLRYKKGRFLEAYERGDLILLDEVNLANEEMLGVLYQLLTMGYLQHNGKVIEPANGKKARVLATANPSSYGGRNRMSEAFMNRFEIVYIDSMTDEEMAEILIGTVRKGLIVSGRYAASEFQRKEQELPAEYRKRMDDILVKELGVTREQLVLIARLQEKLNGALRSGKFLGMGADADYVFTIRNYFNLYKDLMARKKQERNPDLELWLREAFMEYGNVVIRSDVYRLNQLGMLKKDPAYKVLRNIFSVVLGDLILDLPTVRHKSKVSNGAGEPAEQTDTTRPENGYEAFDELVGKWFEKIDYEYDRDTKRLRIDGLTIRGKTSQERKLTEELIETESTKFSQIAILKALLLNEPLLSVGQSGGGKSEAIGDIAQRLGLRYVTVSLGDATLESLLGNMEWNPSEKRFVYVPGILVKAMQEGAVLVLEELNMAKSGVIEILNEYFDEGTFTNPFTLEAINVHPDFRLFATMNPVQGTTGQNVGRVSLSPALRNRFREVWVPHEKTDSELIQILTGLFVRNDIIVEPAVLNKLLGFYHAYQEVFRYRGEATYYTSLRDLTRIVRIMSYLMKTGGMNKEQAMARAVRRVYLAKMITQDDRESVRKLISEAGILPGEIRDPSYQRSPDERFLEVYEGKELVARFELGESLRDAIKGELLEREPGLTGVELESELRDRLNQVISEATLVENAHTLENLIGLMEAVAMSGEDISYGKFNPILLLGETAGGKTSLAKYLAVVILKQSYTRIQINERTDELDLFGSYEPREMEIGLDESIRIVQNAMEENEWFRLKRALRVFKKGSVSGDGLGEEGKDPERILKQLAEDEDEAGKEIRNYLRQVAVGGIEPQTVAEAAHRLRVIAYLVKNGAMNVEMEFREGRFLSAIKRGDFVVLDELNLAGEESIAVLYQFLTLGFVEYYNKDAVDENGVRRPRVEKIYAAPGFKLVATANPSSYGGRNRLSEALMNRFEIQNIQNMTSEQMSEIILGEISGTTSFRKGDQLSEAVKLAVLKLAKFQSDLNLAIERGAFHSAGSGQTQGYLFTLRDLKRIVRSAEEILRHGDSSPPEQVVIQQAYLEYLGVLGRSDEEVARLLSLFSRNEFFPTFDPGSLDFSFEEASDFRGHKMIRMGGFELEMRDYDGRGPSDEANVIEELEEGSLTNLIRIALLKGLIDPRSPVMAIGQSGGGKTEMIGDLCRRLGWRYRSVSLGNASLERLIGGYERDKETKIFHYIVGELVRAMEDGAVFVLEEANMASSGLVEVLNEYFDEGTFTNPLTGKKVKIHSNFRLFATMNPEVGVTGANAGRVGFSPALRSRFKEVWVPHIKTPDETKRIIRKKFINNRIHISDKTVETLYLIYESFRKFVEGYTDESGNYHAPRIGQENNEGYYTSLRDMGKIADIMTQDMRRGVPEKEALRYAVKRIYYLRLNNVTDRKTVQEEVLTGLDMVKAEYVWKLEGSEYVVRRGKIEVARVPVELLKKKKFVLTPSSREQMGFLIEGMSRDPGFKRSFNPVMLFGETSGGKSTMVEIAAHIFRKKFTRIQVNQRTDEYDLLGTYHPVEMKLTLAESVEVIQENLRKKNYSKLCRALRVLKKDVRLALHIPETDPVDDAQLFQRFFDQYVIPGIRREDPRIIGEVKDLAVLIHNGTAGIDLVHQMGMFLEAVGNRDQGIPGQIVLLDEVNLANEEAIGLLYQILTLGYMEYQGERIYPGEGFQLVVSGNPFTYSGRNRMSEAFMNRFEMQVIPEMTPAEMVQILWEGFRLNEKKMSIKVVEDLVDLQFKIHELSMNRAFDGFNLDNSYRFTLRNLERVVADALKRHEVEPGRSVEECIWVEAYIEYAGLLSQSTEDDMSAQSNVARLKGLFHNRLLAEGHRRLKEWVDSGTKSTFEKELAVVGISGEKKSLEDLRAILWNILERSLQGDRYATKKVVKLVGMVTGKPYTPWYPDGDPLFTEFHRVKTEREGETEWIELGGIRVAKLSASEMLEGFLKEFNADIESGLLFGQDGKPLRPMEEGAQKYVMQKILDSAEARWMQEGGVPVGQGRNLKNLIREEAQRWAANELRGARQTSDHIKKLLQKHFYTQAERVEKLVELQSTQIPRMQILKGFRDGGLAETVDTEGRRSIIHKSRPVLEVGQSGGGKTEMIADIARELNWAYTSVALGAASVESLVGEFILNEETGAFEFRKGILVRAMEEGSVLVLEELNMAESGVIEILNEYFDRGTMTIQGRKVQVKIHRNFRLFATMNPTEGRTGKNAGRIPLSPALRSRFREVWVRSERSKAEQYRMVLGGIRDLVKGLMERGIAEETEDVLGILEEDLTRRKIAERAGIPMLPKEQRDSIEDGVVHTAKPTAKAVPAVRMARSKSVEPVATVPAKGDWERSSTEEKKKIYEDTFSIITAKADITLAAGDHWAWNPKRKILTYDEKDIERLSLNALLGVGIHEAMHRIGTRYLSLFWEFFDEHGLENRVFNTLEDGRIENWARFLFGGAATPLRATNDEVVFGSFKDENELVERFVHGSKDKEGNMTEVAYSSAIINFFLYLGKRGSDVNASKVIEKFLKAFEERDPQLRADIEGLLKAGYFGGGRKEDILDPPNQNKVSGVFSKLPMKADDLGIYRFDGNPSESTIEDLAIEQGIIIRECIMPVVYKWALKDLAKGEKSEGEGEGKKGEKGEKSEGEGERESEGGPQDGSSGKATKGKPTSGKSGKNAKPVSADEWRDLWDKLSPEQKKKLLDQIDKGHASRPQDRTAKDSDDYKRAQQDSEIAKPMSERDRLMGFLGKMITELSGYLRDIIQNSVRPKEVTGLKRGRIDMRRLINSMARGFTDMRFYKQRILPQQKNVKFTIVVDESGSMEGMGESGKAASQNASAKGYRALMGVTLLMEVLESLGIDFAVRGYYDTTHLHKRFKGQRIPPGKESEYLEPGHVDIQDGYTTRVEKESLIGELYQSIGRGGNNEGPALAAAIRDAGEAGGEKHFIIVITDGMGNVSDIKTQVEGLRERSGRVGGTKVELIAVGLSNDAQYVPENYGGKYSIWLKDDEIHKLPAELKRILHEVIRGVYQPEVPGSTRFSHLAKGFRFAGVVGGDYNFHSVRSEVRDNATVDQLGLKSVTDWSWDAFDEFFEAQKTEWDYKDYYFEEKWSVCKLWAHDRFKEIPNPDQRWQLFRRVAAIVRKICQQALNVEGEFWWGEGEKILDPIGLSEFEGFFMGEAFWQMMDPSQTISAFETKLKERLVVLDILRSLQIQVSEGKFEIYLEKFNEAFEHVVDSPEFSEILEKFSAERKLALITEDQAAQIAYQKTLLLAQQAKARQARGEQNPSVSDPGSASSEKGEDLWLEKPGDGERSEVRSEGQTPGELGSYYDRMLSDARLVDQIGLKSFIDWSTEDLEKFIEAQKERVNEDYYGRARSSVFEFWWADRVREIPDPDQRWHFFRKAVEIVLAICRQPTELESNWGDGKTIRDPKGLSAFGHFFSGKAFWRVTKKTLKERLVVLDILRSLQIQVSENQFESYLTEFSEAFEHVVDSPEFSEILEKFSAERKLALITEDQAAQIAYQKTLLLAQQAKARQARGEQNPSVSDPGSASSEKGEDLWLEKPGDGARSEVRSEVQTPGELGSYYDRMLSDARLVDQIGLKSVTDWSEEDLEKFIEAQKERVNEDYYDWARSSVYDLWLAHRIREIPDPDQRWQFFRKAVEIVLAICRQPAELESDWGNGTTILDPKGLSAFGHFVLGKAFWRVTETKLKERLVVLDILRSLQIQVSEGKFEIYLEKFNEAFEHVVDSPEFSEILEKFSAERKLALITEDQAAQTAYQKTLLLAQQAKARQARGEQNPSVSDPGSASSVKGEDLWLEKPGDGARSEVRSEVQTPGELGSYYDRMLSDARRVVEGEGLEIYRNKNFYDGNRLRDGFTAGLIVAIKERRLVETLAGVQKRLREVLEGAGVPADHYYFVPPTAFHSNIVSLFPTFRRGQNPGVPENRARLDEAVQKIERVATGVHSYRIRFNGVTLAPDGTVIAQGFVEDPGALNQARRVLVDEIKGIFPDATRGQIVHASLGRIVRPITRDQSEVLIREIEKSRTIELGEQKVEGWYLNTAELVPGGLPGSEHLSLRNNISFAGPLQSEVRGGEDWKQKLWEGWARVAVPEKKIPAEILRTREALYQSRLADALGFLLQVKGTTETERTALQTIQTQFPVSVYSPEKGWNGAGVPLEEQTALFRAIEHVLNVFWGWQERSRVRGDLHEPLFWKADPHAASKQKMVKEGIEFLEGILREVFPSRTAGSSETARSRLSDVLLHLMNRNRWDDTIRSPQVANPGMVFLKDDRAGFLNDEQLARDETVAIVLDNNGGETFAALLAAWVLVRMGKKATLFGKREPMLVGDTTLPDLDYSVRIFDEILKSWFRDPSVRGLEEALAEGMIDLRARSTDYLYEGAEVEASKAVTQSLDEIRDFDSALILGELQYGDFMREQLRRVVGTTEKAHLSSVDLLNPFSKTRLLFLKAVKNPRETVVDVPDYHPGELTRGQLMAQALFPSSQNRRSEMRVDLEKVLKNVKNLKSNVQPATVFVDAEDWENLSDAQKQEYFFVALSKPETRIIVYNERGQGRDANLAAFLKLERVQRTERDLDQAVSAFARPNVPTIHLSRQVMPSPVAVGSLRKRVSFFKMNSEKSGTLATALLWAVSGGEDSRVPGVRQDHGFWTVHESLLESLQRVFDNNFVIAVAA